MEINQESFTECECVNEALRVAELCPLPCGSHCCPYCSVLAAGMGTFSWVPCRQAGWCLAWDAAGWILTPYPPVPSSIESFR